MSDKTFEVERKDLKTILRERYTVDFYQREYKWGNEHINALLQDLYDSFDKDYRILEKQLFDEGPFYCDNFKTYFLGSFVVSKENNDLKIVDGQQRLTSLSIIFLYLLKRFEVEYPSKDRRDIQDLISSRPFAGEETFNIATTDVNVEFYNIQNNKDSNNVITKRFHDTKLFLDIALDTEKKLQYFLYWLREKVLMVEIRTFSTNEAYTIFETMNDRGLNLSKHEMLKGYLLNQVKDKPSYLQKWDTLIEKLSKTKRLETPRDKREDLDIFDRFFISVLQGRYGDWVLTNDLILTNGTAWRKMSSYHRWIKTNSDRIGLITSQDFAKFIDELSELATWYSKVYDDTFFQPGDPFHSLLIVEPERSRTGLLTYILPVLFSVIDLNLTEEENAQRINMIGRLYETLRYRNAWRGQSTTLAGGINANLVALFTNKDTEEIAYFAYKYLEKDSSEAFNPTQPPSSKKSTASSRPLKNILLKIHDALEETEGKPGWLLTEKSVKNATIEHILSNHETSRQYFNSDSEFDIYRNQIGALLILSRTTNSSYQDMELEKKIIKYANDGVLPSLLSVNRYTPEGTIANRPQLNVLVKRLGLRLRPHVPNTRFDQNIITERNLLYSQIIKDVFSNTWFLDKIKEPLEDFDEVYSDFFLENEDFFKRGNDSWNSELPSTQEKLRKIYEKHSKSDNAPLALRHKTKDQEVQGIFLSHQGRLLYKDEIFENPNQLLMHLGLNHKRAWYTLYFTHQDTDGFIQEKRLSDARDEIFPSVTDYE